jgi:hypothetical protein
MLKLRFGMWFGGCANLPEPAAGVGPRTCRREHEEVRLARPEAVTQIQFLEWYRSRPPAANKVRGAPRGQRFPKGRKKNLGPLLRTASHTVRVSGVEMGRSKLPGTLRFRSRAAFYAASAFLLISPICGCVLVGGYRSGSGFFVWPGTLAVVVVALLLVFVLRRR